MKRISALVLFLALLPSVWGQGYFEFSLTMTADQVVPASSSPTVGRGEISLNGTSLQLYVYFSQGPYYLWPTSAGVFGPASPGNSGPLLFEFGNYVIGAPGPGDPHSSINYYGGQDLTAAQVEQVRSGAWYVSIASAAYPNGEIRGQILPVPEPSLLALLAGGILSLGWLRYRRSVVH